MNKTRAVVLGAAAGAASWLAAEAAVDAVIPSGAEFNRLRNDVGACARTLPEKAGKETTELSVECLPYARDLGPSISTKDRTYTLPARREFTAEQYEAIDKREDHGDFLGDLLPPGAAIGAFVLAAGNSYNTRWRRQAD